jgi:hypothetical protein
MPDNTDTNSDRPQTDARDAYAPDARAPDQPASAGGDAPPAGSDAAPDATPGAPGDEVYDVNWGYEDVKQPEGDHWIHIDGIGNALVQFIDRDDIQQYANEAETRTQNSPQARGQAAAQPTDDGDVDLDNDLVARVLRERYVQPDFSGLTGDDVGAMKPTVPDKLLGALMNQDSVNVTVYGDGSATISTTEGEGN